MPKTAREIIKILKQNGFVQVKNNAGSHQKYFNPETNRTVSVPVHSGDIKTPTEKSIFKQAGLL